MTDEKKNEFDYVPNLEIEREMREKFGMTQKEFAQWLRKDFELTERAKMKPTKKLFHFTKAAKIAKEFHKTQQHGMLPTIKIDDDDILGMITFEGITIDAKNDEDGWKLFQKLISMADGIEIDISSEKIYNTNAFRIELIFLDIYEYTGELKQGDAMELVWIIIKLIILTPIAFLVITHIFIPAINYKLGIVEEEKEENNDDWKKDRFG